MSVVESKHLNSLADQNFEGQEFVYRPIPILVPISMGFVFLSFTAAMMPELLFIPVLGASIGFLALRQIRQSNGNLSGSWMALASSGSQILLAVAFALMHVYSFATEVPPGFSRVSFTADISNKGFTNQGGMMGIHPDVEKLVNQKIMVKGYMYPTESMDGITSFVLCRDSGACCFGGQPKITDMIQVRMTTGRGVRFRTGLVACAGVFRAEPTVDTTGLKPVYVMECDHFGTAKTAY
ncbi:MAG: hypothetical protein JSS49_00605 [Planctomycetes bacterium]|nr:hypothetical protein [Planctomycetota bacterium]